MRRARAGWLLLLPLAAAGAQTPQQREARDIFRQLIEINTTDSVGSVTEAAKVMRQRLLDGGFPPDDLQLLGPNDRKMNLVARYRAAPCSAAKPILLMGHLDVVEAKRSDWTTDPFVFTEKDGYFLGRGAVDTKDNDAALVAAFLRMRREGFVPARELILALTADEEGGKSNGVEWLLQHHRDLFPVEFAINTDAGMATVKGKPWMLAVDATEKTYADYVLTTTSPGGHSSEPMPGNAIYRMTAALGKVSGYEFPFDLNAVTRAQLAAMSKLQGIPEAKDMAAILQTPPDSAALKRLTGNVVYNPLLRTTCVATMIEGGHAPNALPGKVTTNVNCRILPGHTQEEVRQTLLRVIGDGAVQVQYKDDAGIVSDRAPDRQSAPPAAPLSAVFTPLKAIAQELFPGVAVVPDMAAGASDGIYTTAAGIPTYNISGMGSELTENRAHGRDERIRVADFDAGCEFFYRYIKAVAK